jgi:hypothetical protein
MLKGLKKGCKIPEIASSGKKNHPEKSSMLICMVK